MPFQCTRPVADTTGRNRHHARVTTEAPDEIADLWSWLADQGFAATDSGTGGGAFGDRLLRMSRGDVGVRAVSDRGQWFLDLSCRAWGGGWFDVPIVTSALGHRPLDEPIELADQMIFIKENLNESLSRTDNADQLSAELAALLERRTQMRFGW